MTSLFKKFLNPYLGYFSQSRNGAFLEWMLVVTSSHDIQSIVCLLFLNKRLAYIHEDLNGICFVSLSWNISYDNAADEIRPFEPTKNQMAFFKMPISEFLCEEHMGFLQKVLVWAFYSISDTSRKDLLDSVVETVVDPVVYPVVYPVVDLVVETVVETVVESVVQPVVQPILKKLCEKGHKNCVKCPNFDKCGRCFTRDGQEHKKHDFNKEECEAKLNGKVKAPKKAK